MTSTATAAGAKDPDVRQILLGYWSSQLLYVAAKLDIADRLAAGPATAAGLAAATGTDPDALYRVLRALASVGIFAQGSDERFSLNAAAEPLRRNAARLAMGNGCHDGGRALSLLGRVALQRADRPPGLRQDFRPTGL